MKNTNNYCVMDEIFTRYEGNPILTPRMWPYRINAVFNPGAVKLGRDTLILARVERRSGCSHLTVARSSDGLTDWRIDNHPTLAADVDNHPEEIWGLEDPRIVFLEEEGVYAVTYVAFSASGPLVSLATTTDFRDFKRQGIIIPPEDKDASLFPCRFKGRYALLHRPVNFSGISSGIWLSFSPDLKHWGDHRLIIEPREKGWWDCHRVGLGAQPLATDLGWLLIYHGVKATASGNIYRVGALLLDLEDPSKVLHRADEWLLSPQETYERVGDVDDVVFPCGMVVEDDELRLYYGAADSCIAVATARLSDLLGYLVTCSGCQVDKARVFVSYVK